MLMSLELPQKKIRLVDVNGSLTFTFARRAAELKTIPSFQYHAGGSGHNQIVPHPWRLKDKRYLETYLSHTKPFGLLICILTIQHEASRISDHAYIRITDHASAVNTL